MGDLLWPTFQKILNVTRDRLHIVPLGRAPLFILTTLHYEKTLAENSYICSSTHFHNTQTSTAAGNSFRDQE